MLAFKLTPTNVDDRKPFPEMTEDLIGKLSGDRGYVSQKLFEELYKRGLELVTKSKKNMKNRLVKLIDKILLRKRAVIESHHHNFSEYGCRVVQLTVQEVAQSGFIGFP